MDRLNQDKEAFIRLVELVILTAVTAMFAYAAIPTLLRMASDPPAHLFHPGVAALIGLLVGMSSLWWLVIRVKPETAPTIGSVTLCAIVLGLLLGAAAITWVLLHFHRRRPFDLSYQWIIYVPLTLLLATAIERIYAVTRYRRFLTGPNEVG